MSKRIRYYSRLALRLFTLFAMIFSILFLDLVNENNVYYAAYGDEKIFSGTDYKNVSLYCSSKGFGAGASASSSKSDSNYFTIDSSDILVVGRSYRLIIRSISPSYNALSYTSVVSSSDLGTVTGGNFTFDYIEVSGSDLPTIKFNGGISAYYECEFICTSDEDFKIFTGYTGTIIGRAGSSLASNNYLCGYVNFNLNVLYDISLIDVTPRETAEILDDIDKELEAGNQLQEESNQLQEEQNETTNNIFSSISDFFGSFFDNLIGIFVPEEGYFEDFFNRLNDFFSDKLGMLYAPIDLFLDMLNILLTADSSDAGIVFPEVKWQEYTVIPETRVSLAEYSKEFPELQEGIYFGTDVIMVGAVLMLLQNKLKEVLKN